MLLHLIEFHVFCQFRRDRATGILVFAVDSLKPFQILFIIQIQLVKCILEEWIIIELCADFT